MRGFRLDQVRRAGASAERFEPRPEVNRRLTSTAGHGPARSAPHDRVWISPEQARWAREQRRVVQECGDGAVIVELSFAGVDWLVREILKEAGDAAVLEPEDAREAVLVAVVRLLRGGCGAWLQPDQTASNAPLRRDPCPTAPVGPSTNPSRSAPRRRRPSTVAGRATEQRGQRDVLGVVGFRPAELVGDAPRLIEQAGVGLALHADAAQARARLGRLLGLELTAPDVLALAQSGLHLRPHQRRRAQLVP